MTGVGRRLWLRLGSGLAAALAGLCVAAPGCRDAAAPSAPAPHAAPAPPAAPLPHSLIEACTPLAAPLEGKASGPPAEPLSDEALPRPRGANDDPAMVRLKALEAVDELRVRLRKDPANPSLHMQLAYIYGAVLSNREARVQHLCRALLSAPRDDEIHETVVAEWMRPGAELDLEVALRPGDRTLPWRDALTAARARDDLADERARARHFEHAMRAQRMVRNGALLRRERVRARVDGSVLDAWAAGQGGELTVVASVPLKKLPKLTGQLLTAGGGAVDVAPGFHGRVLAFGHDASRLFEALVSAAPGRRAIVVARAGAGQLVLSVETVTGERGPVLVRAFAMEPEDSETRALLVAGGLPTAPPAAKP